MTAKKINPIKALQAANESLAKQNSELADQIYELQRRFDAFRVKDTCADASIKRVEEPARRYATPDGPNGPNDIYPPGTGPMQLVWSSGPTESQSVIVCWQGDNFHTFPNKLAAVAWLLGVAHRMATEKLPER